MRSTKLLTMALLSLGIVVGHTQNYGLYIGDRDMERGVVYAFPGITNLASGPFTWPTIVQFSDPNFDWASYDFCYGIAFARGTLWAGNVFGRTLEQFDGSTGAHLSTINPGFGPHGIAVGPPASGSSATYAIYVAGVNTIYRVDPSNGNVAAFANAQSAYALRWRLERTRTGSHPFLYVSGLGSGVYKFDSNRNLVWGPVANSTYGPFYHEIDFAPNGDVLVAITTNCCYSGNGAIWRLDANGNSLGYFATIPQGAYNIFSGTPFGLAVAPDGQYVYVTEYATGLLAVYAYDPNTGQAGNNGNPVSIIKPTSYMRPKLGLALEVGPPFQPCSSTCPEDINRDGIVDDADLLALLFAFGTSCGQ